MKVSVTARHLRLTPPIRSYVEEKVQKAQKYFNHIVWAQVVLSVEKRTHQAEIIIHAGHQTFRGLGKGQDLYSAVDLASDKIDAQLKKYKERLRDHHHKAPELEPAFVGPGLSQARISVIKQVPLHPMSYDEAAREMDALGYTFWLFLDRESKQLQVIFRRLDDSYGLLQPVKRNGR